MTECSTTCQHKSNTTINGWEDAISRVDSEIEKVEAYVTRLRATRKSFMLAKREGVQWPGSIRNFIDRLSGNSATQN